MGGLRRRDARMSGEVVGGADGGGGLERYGWSGRMEGWGLGGDGGRRGLREERCGGVGGVEGMVRAC